MKYEYKIKGMHCGGCSSKLEKAILSIEKVIDAEADHEKGTLTVECDSDISEEIIALVAKTGFEVIK